MKRAAIVVSMALVVGACSGGDDGDATSAASWCDLAEQIVDLEAAEPDLLAVDGRAPESLGRYRTLLGDAAAVAPDAILADANDVADGVDQFVRVAESVDFDFDRLDEGELVDLAGVALELDDAVGRVRTFNATECGLSAPTTPPTVPPTSPPTSPPSPTATSEPTPTFTGDPDSAWCGLSREISDLGGEFETLLLADPVQVEAYMGELLVLLEEAVDAAPPELADAAASSLESFLLLDEAFAAASYDPLDTDLSVLDERGDEMDAANDLIERYNADVCGIEAADDGDGGDFDPTAGTIRDQAIAEFVRQGFTEEEAACIFDNLDFSDPDLLENEAAIAEVLTACGIDLERLMELG